MKEKNIRGKKILIIDDDVNMMDILSVVLQKYGHTLYSYTDPIAAIEELKTNKYDMLIINYLLSPVNGDRIIELVREFNKEIYIILMSIHKDLAPSIEVMQNLDIQAYFEKSSRFDQLIMLIQSGVKQIEQLENIKEMSMKIDKYLFDFANIMLNTISAKDHYTEEHSKRVSAFSVYFGNYLKLNDEDVEKLRVAGLFHDIGKIGCPDSVILKQGKLTDDEYETMKLHPIIGANIVGASDYFKDVAEIMIVHHERIDGKGYPYGKKGDEIPYLGKILAICDSFDAMMSKRPYKDEKSIEFAIGEIDRCKGTQFDEDLAKTFIEILKTRCDDITAILNSQKKETNLEEPQKESKEETEVKSEE